MTADMNLDDVAARVAALLIGRRDTVSVVESSSGGLVAAALLAVPGASRYFVGGAVTYTATARERFLAIDAGGMEGLRSSSEPYARLLAETARTRLGTVWGLAETGAAGPTGNRYGDAAGHSCLAVSGPVSRSVTIETGSADRPENMRAFARAALDLLESALTEAGAA